MNDRNGIEIEVGDTVRVNDVTVSGIEYRGWHLVVCRYATVEYVYQASQLLDVVLAGVCDVRANTYGGPMVPFRYEVGVPAETVEIVNRAERVSNAI
jgi:hypothetical protein